MVNIMKLKRKMMKMRSQRKNRMKRNNRKDLNKARNNNKELIMTTKEMRSMNLDII